MSVSPAQNFSKPPPVPEVPTVTATPPLASSEVLGDEHQSGSTVQEP